MRNRMLYFLAIFGFILYSGYINAQIIDTTGTGTGTGTGTETDTSTGTGTGTGNTGIGTTDDQGTMTGGMEAMSPAATEIQSVTADLMEAVNSSDLSTISDLYTDNAVLLPPDIDMRTGKENIRTFWNSMSRFGMKFDSLQARQISGSGETVTEVGDYTLRVSPPGQMESIESGKFLIVWKKQGDNTWKIDRHMWNRNKR